MIISDSVKKFLMEWGISGRKCLGIFNTELHAHVENKLLLLPKKKITHSRKATHSMSFYCQKCDFVLFV